MELGSLIGVIAGVFFILMSMLLGANFDMAMVTRSFIDYPSVMITIGGTIAATLLANPISKIALALKAVGKAFKPPNLNPVAGIKQIIDFANIARKESILALEEASEKIEDTFLKKGISLVVIGTDPDLVRNILETEMEYIETRHSNIRGVWDFIGSAGPAWGMIGTLIGLALMLQDMSDPDQLGPKMAVALITTFYGSVMANFIAIPFANKLKIFSNEEMLLKQVMIEGILSIQAGENPRIIEEKLKAFLAPSARDFSNSGDKKKSSTEAGEE